MMLSATTKTMKDTTMMITNKNRGCGFQPQSFVLRTMLHLLYLSLILIWPCATSAQIPAEAPTGPIALTEAEIFPISGPRIDKGTVLIEDGKIKAIGTDIEIPSGTTTISLAGKAIFPGFIESHSQLGLTEIAAVKATNDYREPGAINPNVKALVSINMENVILPVTRSGGVLVALSAPEGGIISGRSSIVQLEGWTYEDMAIKPIAALQVKWPMQSLHPRMIARLKKEKLEEEKEELEEHKEELSDFFEMAKAYHQGRSQTENPPAFDSKLEAMRDVIAGKVPMMVRADRAGASLLKQYDVPVIVSATHRLPLRRDDRHDESYTLPARLQKAGVKFCISSTDRSETWNARNLPFQAATAAAWGLDIDQALRAITLSPAEILGIDDRVGSLEVGKDATLIVTSGNPLEAISTIDRAWIGGREIDKNIRPQCNLRYIAAATVMALTVCTFSSRSTAQTIVLRDLTLIESANVASLDESQLRLSSGQTLSWDEILQAEVDDRFQEQVDDYLVRIGQPTFRLKNRILSNNFALAASSATTLLDSPDPHVRFLANRAMMRSFVQGGQPESAVVCMLRAMLAQKEFSRDIDPRMKGLLFEDATFSSIVGELLPVFSDQQAAGTAITDIGELGATCRFRLRLAIGKRSRRWLRGESCRGLCSTPFRVRTKNFELRPRFTGRRRRKTALWKSESLVC